MIQPPPAESSKQALSSPPTPVPPPAIRRGLSVLQIVLLTFVALSLVAVGAIFVVFYSGSLRPSPNAPVIRFSAVDVDVYAGVAGFSVTSASAAVGPRNYQVSLAVDAAYGSPVALPSSGSIWITVGSATYAIRWSDLNSDELLSAGDRLTVSRVDPAGGFPYGSRYVFYLLWSDGGFVQSAAWEIPSGPPTKPVLTFSQVTLSDGATVARFVIADASQAVTTANYKFNLKVNGTFGTAKALGTSGTGVTISVNGVTYTVTYTDVGNDGTVNGGDQFTVSGLRSSTQYVFVLLWSDGSQVQFRDWNTP